MGFIFDVNRYNVSILPASDTIHMYRMNRQQHPHPPRYMRFERRGIDTAGIMIATLFRFDHLIGRQWRQLFDNGQADCWSALSCGIGDADRTPLGAGLHCHSVFFRRHGKLFVSYLSGYFVFSICRFGRLVDIRMARLGRWSLQITVWVWL